MTASISGRIKSQQGEPLSGIAIKLTHEPTGSAFAKTSDATGQYQFESVKAGGPYYLSLISTDSGSSGQDSFHLKVDEVFTHNFIL
jgi:hypothetical protein